MINEVTSYVHIEKLTQVDKKIDSHIKQLEKLRDESAFEAAKLTSALKDKLVILAGLEAGK